MTGLKVEEVNVHVQGVNTDVIERKDSEKLEEEQTNESEENK